jgi:hypothetical protein
MPTSPSRQTLLVVLLATLAVLAGCAGGLSGDRAAPASSDGGAEYSGQQSAQATGGGGVGSYYTDDGDRVVVRESEMALQVQNFSKSFHRLRTIAAENGGYVGDRSQRSEGEWDAGDITIRVPPAQFASARDAISKLGQVEDERVRVLDFTTAVETRADRIQDLRQEEQALQNLLNRTTDIDDANRVRSELREVRDERRELERQQASVAQRERLSTIEVSMREPDARKPPKNYDSAFGFTDAFLEAFYGGLQAVKLVIVFFGYAIPLGISLLALGAFGLVLLSGWRRLRVGLYSALGIGPAPSVAGLGRGDGPATEPDDDAGSDEDAPADEDAE